MLKKVAYKKEPILSIHKYVVTVGCFGKLGDWKTKFHYCTSLKEVRAIAKSCKKDSIIEVHRATHNFIQAFSKA